MWPSLHFRKVKGTTIERGKGTTGGKEMSPAGGDGVLSYSERCCGRRQHRGILQQQN